MDGNLEKKQRLDHTDQFDDDHAHKIRLIQDQIKIGILRQV